MIGSNYSLRPGQSQMRPAPVQSAQPLPSSGLYDSLSATDDTVNHTIARGRQNADERFNLEQLDKPGISRGRGQQFLAAQAGILAMGQANAQADRTRLADRIATLNQQGGLLSGLLN